MKKTILFYVLAGSFAITPICASSATWVTVDGYVQTASGTPVCAMVLANGEYMFSCDGTGAFDLEAPLDTNGEITLFSFASGFAPFRSTLGPNFFPHIVLMETASPDSPLIDMSRQSSCATDNSVRLTGDIQTFGGLPLCAMVLANGQQMFTCGDNLGHYDLTVPVDQNGEITIFGFASGFQPYRETFTAPYCDVRFAEINGVEFTYRLVEEFYSSTPYCAVQVDAVNTTSDTKDALLYFDAFDEPNHYLSSTYLSIYLPPYAEDSTVPYPDDGAFPFTLNVGCDIIYSWNLNTDVSRVHTF